MSDFIYLLDQHERTIGHLSNEAPQACPYYNDKLIEDLETGAQTYEFYIPANHPDAGNVLKNGYIVRPGFDDQLMQFQITQIEEVHENDILYKYIFCEFAWSELNGDIIRPYNLLGTDALTAITYALNGTRWKPGKVEYLGTADLSSSGYDTALKMAQDIKEAFDGEIRFYVTMNNGVITGRFVDLVERVGANQGKVIAFEKNLTSAKRIHDRTTVATALIGLGKGNENSEQITFTGEVWRQSDGDPVEKAAGQDWIGDPEALKTWGIDGRHITQVYEYATTSPAILLQKTWEELQRRKNGLLQYEAGAALLDALGWDWDRTSIGDDTLIQDHFFEPMLMVNARIIKLERSFTDPTTNSATFGDYQPAISQAGALAAIQSTLLKNEKVWSEPPQGMASVVRSDLEPTKTDGVIWVQPAAGTRPYDLIRTYNPANGLWEESAPLDAADLGAEANIFKQDTAPPHLAGRLWMDTSKTPNILNRSTGTAWVKVTPTQASEVGADPTGSAATAKTDAINAAATDATSKANSAQTAAENLARSEATAAETRANAYADGQITAEEQARIDQANANLEAAKTDAQTKANAAQTAAESVARSEAATAQQNAQGFASTTSENRAKIAEYTAINSSIDTAKKELMERSQAIIDDSAYYTAALISTINTQRQAVLDKSSQVAGAVSSYTTDGIIDASEQSLLDDYISQYNTAAAALGKSIQEATQDAGGIRVGTLTGITLQVANAGISNEGTLSTDARIWAGNSYTNRNSAPFRVTHAGKVFASDIEIVGGSINIDSDLFVGDNIYLGSTATDMVRKSIYFNSMANITGGGGYVGGTLEFNASDGIWDFQNHMLNYGMNLQNSSPTGALVKFTTESNVESEFSGVVRLYGGVGIAQPSYSMYVNESTKGEWITNAQETGFCGVGGVTAGINGSVAGVGVNFRIRKNYTPSSITLAATSHNLTVATNVFAIDIGGNGFWLYVNSGSTTAAYRYWRGTYSA